MTTTTLDPDASCTDAQLDEFLGGKIRGAATILPATWESAKPARRFALETVMAHLRRLPVPVYEYHLQDPTELRNAVLFGAAAHIYVLAMTRGGDIELFAKMATYYQDKFDTEVAKLNPSVTGYDVGEEPSIGPDGQMRPRRAKTRSIGLVRR